ncbi:hypothetical protein Ga0074812_1087 [Parafrankia irregularis]|uniref:Uncharacterized protein n=1 Tax=Parafrankia irregularis TaxID=795642 RepID=A0A0S4QLM7_9ACTN|nr:hypothetical protein Ga0074812_1087 [Parafrankia irregularis]
MSGYSAGQTRTDSVAIAGGHGGVTSVRPEGHQAGSDGNPTARAK